MQLVPFFKVEQQASIQNVCTCLCLETHKRRSSLFGMGFWSGNPASGFGVGIRLFLIAPFPDRYLLVPFHFILFFIYFVITNKKHKNALFDNVSTDLNILSTKRNANLYFSFFSRKYKILSI